MVLDLETINQILGQVGEYQTPILSIIPYCITLYNRYVSNLYNVESFIPHDRSLFGSFFKSSNLID